MMNDALLHRLDHVTILAPLGLRFWDVVFNIPVTDGLRVTAYPLNNPARRVQGVPNRSGAYVLHNLPGLRAVENGAGDAEFWANLPLRQPFVVEVVDNYRRFQPFLFSINLPAKGLSTLECVPGSPPDAELPGIPLYSAPTRPVPGAMAVLRATLTVPDPGDPLAVVSAAWAMLEVQVVGHPPVRGLADAEGRIAVIFPYPEPVDFADDPESPVSLAAGAPLTAQIWPVRLYATYTLLDAVPPIPDLCATLMQSPAELWLDSTRTQQLTEVSLKFGEELVVRSIDSASGTLLPNLFITPAI